MKLETPDMTQDNIEKLEKLFPEVVTEVKDENGKTVKGIHFETLKQVLSPEALDGDEAYDFTWVGKKNARVEANTPIRKTLRPCKEESKDWDRTENIYIEGDNLDVLKLLQESYIGKIKIIYIDPPYNTGHDFIYHDRFDMDKNEYDNQTGLFDEEGKVNFKENSNSNPRFHSDWCSMIYPRLMLARNLLSDDGAIFISIDDNEQANLKRMCDEIFGEANYIGLITVISNPRGSQNSKFLSNIHEYLLMYAKKSSSLEISGISKDDESLNEFCETDNDGRKYRYLGLRKRGGAWRKEDRPNMYYPIYVNPRNGQCSLKKGNGFIAEVIPKRPTGELSRWTWGKDKFIKESNLIVGKQINRSGEKEWDIFRKDYMDNDAGMEKKTKIKTVWTEKETNYQNAKNEIKMLFGNSEIFDYPKPIYIAKTLVSMFYAEGDIILDFFSGSATTAHAIIQLNAEDGEHRKFIMVQLQEECHTESEAFKAGYKNICEIGKERIRRAGEKIKADSPLTTADLDIGFRVFKVDDSNMKDIYYSAGEYTKDKLKDCVSNIKEDRTDMDLLYGCMLDWGLELSLPYKCEKIDGTDVHFVNGKDLIACFADNVSEKAVREIANRKPLRAVFRDSSFRTSPEKINVEEIFKLISPDTTVKVL